MTDPIARLSAALAGRYRIEREIGAGGMATVYLAQDVRHDRKVALKVLRPELSAILGGERFLTEIKTTANLQHPHILSLFDSGEADGLVFYVMPYVDGESLRDRLTRERQLPVDAAVRIAREVADALEYAHRHGVVHRDIKPENILLQGGHALVADFGIALAASRSEGGARMTETGLSLGTPHYMSPEQAMGQREITAASDVYALGCVLYEMLSGEPPFSGPTPQAIIARVMTETPRSLTLQRRTVPAHVDAAIRTALEKVPADRFASAAAFAAALDNPAYATVAALPAVPAAAAGRRAAAMRRAATALPWMLALVALGLFAHERLRPAPTPTASRFALRVAPTAVTALQGQVIAVSPDGTKIVYIGSGSTGNQLFLRPLAQVATTPIPGTENALSPFFSPDGKFVAFVSGSKLMKVALAGGPPLTIAVVGNAFRGGTWSERDSILFADEQGLQLVSAGGGKPERIASPDSASRESYRWPEFLPGSHAAVLAINDGNEDRIAVFTPATRALRRLDVPGSNPHYVAGGYLLLAVIPRSNGNITSGSILAMPFDAQRLTVLGAPAAVTDSVQVGVNSRTAKLGVSRDGSTLAFASGSIGRGTIVAVSREGQVRDLGTPPQFYQTPRLSPDGRRIAAQVVGAASDVWVFDIGTKTLTRLTFDGSALRPTWTPDGRRVVYERRGLGNSGEDLAWIPADGSAPAESLVTTRDDQTPGVFTANGRTMLIREQPSGGTRRISVVQLDSARVPRPLIESTFDNSSPSLSPDGRWLAYASDEQGRSEIYVRPFPGPGGRWQVSKDGGTEPIWSHMGNEIFFRVGASVMAVPVQTAGASVAAGDAKELFKTTATPGVAYPSYDVSRDGRTFILSQPLRENDQSLTVMLNWFEQLPVAGR